MKIVLLKDVRGVGRRFEEKEVPNGYAANFLIPQKLAVPFSSGAQVLEFKRQEERAKLKNLGELEEKLGSLDDISIEAAGNEKGHLFASVGKDEISKITGLPEEIIILDKPIKEFGNHLVMVKVGEKEKKIKLEVKRLESSSS